MSQRLVFLISLTNMFILIFTIKAWSLMIYLSVEELVKRSDLVVLGEVLDVASDWSEDRRTIFTKARVKVNQVLRGSYNEVEIIVKYEGGEVEGIGLRISNSPSLKKGEKVILFLELIGQQKSSRIFNITGKAQGKYTIREDGTAFRSGFSIVKGSVKGSDDEILVDELIYKVGGIDR